ncbi:MAG: hypothetical protein WBG76_02535, partial [Ornithinimicrobium sp.]
VAPGVQAHTNGGLEVIVNLYGAGVDTATKQAHSVAVERPEPMQLFALGVKQAHPGHIGSVEYRPERDGRAAGFDRVHGLGRDADPLSKLGLSPATAVAAAANQASEHVDGVSGLAGRENRNSGHNYSFYDI